MPDEVAPDEVSVPEIPPRYDELAEGYARHWGPVIRPAAVALLDRLPAQLGPGTRILDVGTGTGTLPLEILARWPEVEVTGIDPSPAMLRLASAALERPEGAGQEGTTQAPGPRAPAPEPAAPGTRHFTAVTAFADALPFDDAAFDVALSSFVLQLVPDRGAALREIRRVLRPGGRLAWVAWLVGGDAFRADEVVDRVLDEFGFDPPQRDGRSGDPASAAAAAAATRRAGFGRVTAAAGTLVHHWTAESYRAFVMEFDEQSTFAELGRRERREAGRRLLAELRRLTPDELTTRMPVVYVSGIAR
jgi:ubiquinone/menaquinone biosynthesis C-methylase UbiE